MPVPNVPRAPESASLQSPDEYIELCIGSFRMKLGSSNATTRVKNGKTGAYRYKVYFQETIATCEIELTVSDIEKLLGHIQEISAINEPPVFFRKLRELQIRCVGTQGKRHRELKPEVQDFPYTVSPDPFHGASSRCFRPDMTVSYFAIRENDTPVLFVKISDCESEVLAGECAKWPRLPVTAVKKRFKDILPRRTARICSSKDQKPERPVNSRKSNEPVPTEGFGMRQVGHKIRDQPGMKGVICEFFNNGVSILKQVIPRNSVESVREYISSSWQSWMGERNILLRLSEHPDVKFPLERKNGMWIKFEDFGREHLGGGKAPETPDQIVHHWWTGVVVYMRKFFNLEFELDSEWERVKRRLREQKDIPICLSYLIENSLEKLKVANTDKQFCDAVDQRNKLFSLLRVVDFNVDNLDALGKQVAKRSFAVIFESAQHVQLPGCVILLRVNKKLGGVLNSLLQYTADQLELLQSARADLKDRSSYEVARLRRFCTVFTMNGKRGIVDDHGDADEKRIPRSWRVVEFEPRLHMLKKDTEVNDRAHQLMAIFDLHLLFKFTEECVEKLESQYDLVLGMAIFVLTQLCPIRTGSVLSAEVWSAIRLASAKPDDVFVPFMFANRKLQKIDQMGNRITPKQFVLVPLPYAASRIILLYLLIRQKLMPPVNGEELLFVTEDGREILDARKYTTEFMKVYCEWRKLDFKEVSKLAGNKMARGIFGANKRTADSCNDRIVRNDIRFASYEHGDRVIDSHYAQAEAAYRQAVVNRILSSKMHAGRYESTPQYIMDMARLDKELYAGHAGKVFERVMKKPLNQICILATFHF